jgi:hypothetical protein
MCWQCVRDGDSETTWNHWCPKCLAYLPWKHEPVSRFRRLRSALWLMLRFRFSVRWESK